MIVLLSTSDTDLLSARASGAGYRLGNPARLTADDVPALIDGADVVVVRILGGRRAWEDGLDAVLMSDLSRPGKTLCIVMPVVVRTRVVALLLGDGGETGIDKERLKSVLKELAQDEGSTIVFIDASARR